MRYFTGTTYENFESMKRDGYIRRKPNRRVWEDNSGDYVYLFAFDKEENKETQVFDYAKEQAVLSVAKLKHTKRVVLEIEGIEEERIEPDPESVGLPGVRYPEDIPLSQVVKVHVEVEESQVNARKLLALDDFIHVLQHQPSFRGHGKLFVYGSPFEKSWAQKQIRKIITDFELLNPSQFQDEEALERAHVILREKLQRAPFKLKRHAI